MNLDEFPDLLRPIAQERLQLPSGNEVPIHVTRPCFTTWEGEPPPTYGGKCVLDVGGHPGFAEQAIMKALQQDGWKAIWVDSYGKRYLRGMPHDPANIVSAHEVRSSPPCERFPNGFARFGGCWDVVGWKGNRVVFCESKRSGRDAIRKSQLTWLDRRLAENARPEDFLIVEWDTASPVDGALAAPWLRTGQWYAWTMYPGYGGGAYLTPIFMKSLEWDRIGCTAHFLNALYAQGVQEMGKRLRLVAAHATYAVMAEVADPERTVLISEMTWPWLEPILPPRAAPRRDGEGIQAYLGRLWPYVSEGP